MSPEWRFLREVPGAVATLWGSLAVAKYGPWDGKAEGGKETALGEC